MHHCGIMLERDGVKIVVASDTTHKARFVNADKIHKRYDKPIAIIEVGTYPVSITQLQDFIQSSKHGYKVDALGIFLWYVCGRFLLPLVNPVSCSLLTCNLLRLCGIKVQNHIAPNNLYKELLNATDSNSGAS